MLLAHRVDIKLRGRRVTDVLNRLHVAMPQKRDNIVSFSILIRVFFCIIVRIIIFI